MSKLPLIFISLFFTLNCTINGDLFDAAAAGDMKRVQFLISLGANVNAKDDREREIKGTRGPNYTLPPEYQTPLMYAVINGHRSIAELLVAKGADTELKDIHGMTPLMYAAMYKYPDIVELLVEKGADIDAKDRNGQPVLVFALAGGGDIAEYLMDKGADVTARDGRNRTVLMYAVKYGMKYERIIRRLIGGGVGLEAADKGGKTVMDYVIDNPEVAELLVFLGNG